MGSTPVLEPTLPILLPARHVQTLLLPPISLLSQFVPGTFWSSHSCPYPFSPPWDPNHVSSEPYRQSWLYSAFFRDSPLLAGFTNKPCFLKTLPDQLGMEAWAFHCHVFASLHDESSPFGVAECASSARIILQILGETITVAENTRPFAPSL